MIHRHLIRRIRRFIVHDVLHADDPPHRLALGIAIGVFFAFSPAFGAQMALVVFFAWLLRANKLVGTPIVWISNPATVIPIYYICYLLGTSLIGGERVGKSWWSDLAQPPSGWFEGASFYWSKLLEIAGPLTLGCVLIGIVFACPAYFLTYYTIRCYRYHRWRHSTVPVRPQSKTAVQE